MPFTQTQIDILKAAIAEGALTVKYADKEVTYRSLAEMRQILDMMEAEVNPSTRPSKRRYAEFDKGLS